MKHIHRARCIASESDPLLSTDQHDVGEVDDDDGGSDEELATGKDVLFQNDRQREGDGASKTAVRHHERTHSIQLRDSHQVRQVIQHSHH